MTGAFDESSSRDVRPLEVRSESDQTKATDDDLVNATQEPYGGTAAQRQPVPRITKFSTDLGWNVRLRQ
eukprot:2494622-Pleurochrysis_carterae.AAC.1